MSKSAADVSGDVASGFAALMSKAAGEAGGPADEAPFGYTTDPDGTVRPKKTAGRPRRQPTLEELKAEREAAPPADAPAGDRAPSARRIHRRKGNDEPDTPKPPIPQHRDGVITKGVNRLYRRTGKMVRVMDRDVGQALIDITVKDDDEDVTVGEAWEELARTNPRVRAFLLKIIAGGAVGQVLMAHAPVLLAILMKDAIRRHIPFMKLMEAFLTGDDEPGGDGTAPADGTVVEGLTMPDMQQMMAMAQQFADQAMSGRANGGTPRPPAPGPDATVAGLVVSGS
jgi:hypothetical protein